MFRRFTHLSVSLLVLATLATAGGLLAADPTVEQVTVNHQPATPLSTVLLSDEHLIDGQIVIAGRSAAPEVEYSVDAGKTWGVAPVGSAGFRIAIDPRERSRDFTVLLRTRGGSRTFAVVVRFRSRRLLELFEKLFADMRDVYMDERLDEFLQYFDEDHYDHFVQFKENMENTFDFNANINLLIQIGSIEVDNDVALVRIDWQRTWDAASRARGTNDIVRFGRVRGRWLITDIEDEAVFIIGTGTFRGNVSDR